MNMKTIEAEGLSMRSLNDATAKALFDVSEKIGVGHHIDDMNIENMTAPNGAYKVAVTVKFSQTQKTPDKKGNKRDPHLFYDQLRAKMRGQQRSPHIRFKRRAAPAEAARLYRDNDTNSFISS